MIPRALETYLHDHLPESLWASRLVREDGRWFYVDGVLPAR